MPVRSETHRHTSSQASTHEDPLTDASTSFLTPPHIIAYQQTPAHAIIFLHMPTQKSRATAIKRVFKACFQFDWRDSSGSENGSCDEEEAAVLLLEEQEVPQAAGGSHRT